MAGLKMLLVMSLILGLSYEPIAAYCPSCPKDCCFDFRTGRPIPLSRIVSYYRTHSECNLQAVVIVTQIKKELCVNPAEPWVQRVISKVPEKNPHFV